MYKLLMLILLPLSVNIVIQKNLRLLSGGYTPCIIILRIFNNDFNDYHIYSYDY